MKTEAEYLRILFDKHIRGSLYKPATGYPSPRIMLAGLRYALALNVGTVNELRGILDGPRTTRRPTETKHILIFETFDENRMSTVTYHGPFDTEAEAYLYSNKHGFGVSGIVTMKELALETE